MKTALNYIKNKLLYPFKHDLLYFIILWLFVSIPVYYQSIVKIEPFPLTMLLMYYAITYVIVFCLNLNQNIAKVLKPITVISLAIWLALNIYCIYMYNGRLSYDFVQIIRGTNIDEVREYIKTYFSFKDAILIILFLFLCIFAYIFTTRFKIKMTKMAMFLAFIPLVVSPFKIWQHYPDVKRELFDAKWMFKSDEIIELRNHLSHPHVLPIHYGGGNPQVIIILGESFSPSHSSLYGYDKDTNPLLRKKLESGDLIVFPNVTSPQASTTAAFRYLLNTYQLGMEEQSKWYESVNLIEVMNTIGYHTVWISNQDPIGVHDNIPSGHAKICNESVFMVKDAEGHKYDGEMVKIEISQKEKPLAVFYHLMGQHVWFPERYPAEYDRFTSTNYKTGIIAKYDNTILYNDYVINSLIEKYQNENAVIFYMSDHGLDMFETDPNYFGHAKQTLESQIIGKKIPFMVYLSPLYQQLRPEITERIKFSVGKEFCTDKLIYAVMDAIGYKFADNDDVKKYSLFTR